MFGVYSRCQRHYHYVKGCNSGASQRILSEQVVTCLVHSKELILPSTGREGAAGGVGGVHDRSLSLGLSLIHI